MAQAEIGLIGLGVMGSNLALNIAEKGNKIAVFNRTVARTKEFYEEAGDLKGQIVPCETIEEFVAQNESFTVERGPDFAFRHLAADFLDDLIVERAIHMLLRANHFPVRAVNAFQIAVRGRLNDDLRRERMALQL